MMEKGGVRMRLFIAIPLSPQGRAALVQAQTALRKQGASGNFTRSENLHLTLAFLGETEDTVGALAAMAESCRGVPFPMVLSGTGRFGDLWWAGIEPSPRLKQLAESLQSALRRRGFSVEKRPFRPHITLVRQLTAPRPPVLTVPPTAITVEKISLMESRRMAGRLVYTEVDSVCLSDVPKEHF